MEASVELGGACARMDPSARHVRSQGDGVQNTTALHPAAARGSYHCAGPGHDHRAYTLVPHSNDTDKGKGARSGAVGRSARTGNDRGHGGYDARTGTPGYYLKPWKAPPAAPFPRSARAPPPHHITPALAGYSKKATSTPPLFIPVRPPPSSIPTYLHGFVPINTRNSLFRQISTMSSGPVSPTSEAQTTSGPWQEKLKSRFSGVD